MGPNQIFFEGSKSTFGFGVALGVVPRCENLLDAEHGTRLHESLGGRLTAVIADQGRRFFSFSDFFRELRHDGLVKGIEPVLRFRLEAEGITDDLFGVPVEHDDQVHPTPIPELDLGHINPPEFVELMGFNLRFHGSTTSSQTHVLGDQELLCFHDAVHSFFIDWQAFPVFEVGPNTTITPKRVLGFKLDDSLE